MRPSVFPDTQTTDASAWLGSSAWYVYAVTAPGQPAPPVPGVLPGREVESLPFRPLAILASRVPRALFDAGRRFSRVGDADWVAERTAAHHAVIHAAIPCLPMRFGTLFRDLGALQAWLAPRVSILKPALAQAARHTEWMLTLREDPDRVSSWLGTERQAERRADLARAGAAVAGWAQASRLALLADIGRGGLPAWTVLVPHDRAMMMARGGNLPADLPDGLSLQLSGPWPAYGLAAAALAMEPAHV
jgi:Gas vesicle synthesis protein GvpL/GvpF